MITTPAGEPINTTKSVNMTSSTTIATTNTAVASGIATTASNTDTTTTAIIVGMTATSGEGMTTTSATKSISSIYTPALSMTAISDTSGVGMTTITAIPSTNTITVIPSAITITITAISRMSTITATSSMGIASTASSVRIITATSSVNTISGVSVATTASSMNITSTKSSVHIITATSSVIMISDSSSAVMNTPTSSVDNITSDTSSMDNNDALLISVAAVIIVLILCCCIMMDILFCFCCKRKEQLDQSNEGDKSFKTVQCSIIVLGVLTCGTSVLLWWLFKGCCTSKEKYNVKGHTVLPASSSKEGSCKEKQASKKSAHVEMTDASSIQGSPTELNYAETTKSFNGATQTGPTVQYDYTRTGPVMIVNGTVSIKPTSKPEIESYAMNEILPDTDKRKNEKEDIKAKTDDKNQQPLIYSVVDKSKKHNKKQKREINYMDPSNIEFAEQPHNRVSSKEDYSVEYADVVGSVKYINI